MQKQSHFSLKSQDKSVNAEWQQTAKVKIYICVSRLLLFMWATPLCSLCTQWSLNASGCVRHVGKHTRPGLLWSLVFSIQTHHSDTTEERTENIISTGIRLLLRSYRWISCKFLLQLTSCCFISTTVSLLL